MAEVFMNFVVKLYGFPTSIVSDGQGFHNIFWHQLFKLRGTSTILSMSTAYYPQSDDKLKLSTSVWKCTSTALRIKTLKIGIKKKASLYSSFEYARLFKNH